MMKRTKYEYAPPRKGRANEELIKFLSDSLKIPKDSIKIISDTQTQENFLKSLIIQSFHGEEKNLKRSI